MTGRCEITWDGYLHVSAALAERYFPADVCVAVKRGPALELLPLHGQGNGGLMFKRRTARGDRSLLINEVLGFAPHPGEYPVSWDAARGALIIALGEDPTEGTDVERQRRANGDHQGVRPVGGLSAGDRAGGNLTAEALRPSQRARGAVVGLRRSSRGASAPAAPALGSGAAGVGVGA